MPARPMTASDETRILDAVEDAAGYGDDGCTPDVAIAKAAADHGVPRGHLGLMVNAYNIGRTDRQRRDGETLAEKAASFPLASLGGVIAALYPDTPTTKAAAERASGVDPAYSLPPSGYRERLRAGHVASMTKAASASSPVPAPASPVDPAVAAHRVELRVQKRARNLAEVRRWASSARDAFLGSVAKLASALEAPGAPAIADIRANVEILHGESGLHVLDHVALTREPLAKRASSAYFDGHPVSRFAAAYGGVAGVIAAADALRITNQLHAAAIKEAAALDRVELAPYVPPPASLIDRIELEADLRKHASIGLGDKALNAGIFTGVSHGLETFMPDEGDGGVGKQLSRISSPEHEQALRAIQARAMLHEMLHDDEILSGHDPHEVARHYNRLSQYAPHLADQPLAAIPAVRKSVQQGQLDSFDAAELAGTEGKLKSNRKGQEGQP